MSATLSTSSLRARFPSLAHTTHLSACSIAPRSTDLDSALAAMIENLTTAAPWPAIEEQTTLARQRFAALIGADTEQVALVPNVSTGAFQAASARQWHQRHRLVTTAAEFPSLAHVWLAQRSRGAQIVMVGSSYGTVTGDDYLAAIDARTAFVSIPMVTYRDSLRLPVINVAAAARAAGASVFVDASQAAGVEPIDVRSLGCDYLAAATSKYLLGLPGVAFLYARDPASDPPPVLTGWFGRVQPFAFNPHQLDYAQGARRYETGTPATPSIYAANAGLEFLAELDMFHVRRHVAAMTAYAAGRLIAAGETVRLPADPEDRGAHVALIDSNAAALGDWLAARGIAVAPRGDVVRIAAHAYTSYADIDVVCTSIGDYRRIAHPQRGENQ